MHFLVIFLKNVSTKKVLLQYFLKNVLKNYTSIFDLIWLKFRCQKNLRKKLSSKVLF
jgi:hypothetical protein